MMAPTSERTQPPTANGSTRRPSLTVGIGATTGRGFFAIATRAGRGLAGATATGARTIAGDWVTLIGARGAAATAGRATARGDGHVIANMRPIMPSDSSA